MDQDGVKDLMICRNCGQDDGSKFIAHCENSQCNWLRCVKCNHMNVIRKEGV